MMKVLVITDSLGLPRPVPEVVEPEETWVGLLSKKYDVVSYCSGGSTIKDLYSQIAYFKMYRPEVVFIQSGIVDCAPRAFSQFENEFINKFSLTQRISRRFLTKDKIINLRRKRNKTYTPIDEYEKYVANFNNAFPNVYWVEILSASDDYEKIVPGIQKNVQKYNRVLHEKSNGNVISTGDFSADDIMNDNIHLTKSGNQKLFVKVSLQIEKLLGKAEKI